MTYYYVFNSCIRDIFVVNREILFTLYDISDCNNISLTETFGRYEITLFFKDYHAVIIIFGK